MGQHIIFDFDGTITEDDTIGNLTHAALRWRKTPEGGGIDLTEAWQDILHSYSHDLAVYDQTQPTAQQRTTWQQERDYLHGRSVVEETSLARVRASGLFAGFAADDRPFEAGRRDRETGRTRIRSGFAEYVAMVREREDTVHVVSVNWSASYIRGVLDPWGITSIIANEIQPDGSIIAPFQFRSQNPNNVDPLKALATSCDKLEATQRLLGTTTGGKCIGYFGDSTTDLECLGFYGGYVLTSDGESTLARTLRRLHYAMPCISEPQGAFAHISWAPDFAEIAAQAKQIDID